MSLFSRAACWGVAVAATGDSVRPSAHRPWRGISPPKTSPERPRRRDRRLRRPVQVFAENTVNKGPGAARHQSKDHRLRDPGGAYYGSYERAGGELVAPTSGQAGDLIQVITPSQRHSDSPDTRDKNNESIPHRDHPEDDPTRRLPGAGQQLRGQRIDRHPPVEPAVLAQARHRGVRLALRPGPGPHGRPERLRRRSGRRPAVAAP